MTKLNAYLTFNGKCKEAMEFYKSCLGGELRLMTVGESPMAARSPAEMKDKVLHSLLTNGEIRLMASDTIGARKYRPGNTVSLCLVCESKREIETLFTKLAQEAKSANPLREEFFGAYGELVDKDGFGWMFQYSKKQQ